MKNCPDVSLIAAHLNNTTISTQTPVSSGENGNESSVRSDVYAIDKKATPFLLFLYVTRKHV